MWRFKEWPKSMRAEDVVEMKKLKVMKNNEDRA